MRGRQSERVGFLLHRFPTSTHGSTLPALDHGHCLHNKLARIYHVQLQHLRAEKCRVHGRGRPEERVTLHVPHFTFFACYALIVQAAGAAINNRE